MKALKKWKKLSGVCYGVICVMLLYLTVFCGFFGFFWLFFVCLWVFFERGGFGEVWVLFGFGCILTVGFVRLWGFFVNSRDHYILPCYYSFSLVCFAGESQSFQMKENINILVVFGLQNDSSASFNSDECHRNM